MRLRCSLLLLASAALTAMAWPALACAKSWPVYQNNGHRAGSVQKRYATTDSSDYDKPLAEVFQNTTMVRYCGKITYMWSEAGRARGWWDLYNGADLPTGDHVRMKSANRYDVVRWESGAWRAIGKAARGRSGPWRLMSRTSGSFRVVGHVPRGCPGFDAAGGAYLLAFFGMPPD